MASPARPPTPPPGEQSAAAVWTAFEASGPPGALPPAAAVAAAAARGAASPTPAAASPAGTASPAAREHDTTPGLETTPVSPDGGDAAGAAAAPAPRPPSGVSVPAGWAHMCDVGFNLGTVEPQHGGAEGEDPLAGLLGLDVPAGYDAGADGAAAAAQDAGAEAAAGPAADALPAVMEMQPDTVLAGVLDDVLELIQISSPTPPQFPEEVRAASPPPPPPQLPQELEAPSPPPPPPPSAMDEVEVLDLDDPETEAMLAERAAAVWQNLARQRQLQLQAAAVAQASAQARANSRAQAGAPALAHAEDEVVVIESGDEGEDEAAGVELSVSDPYSVHGNMYGIATVGEVFGGRGDAHLAPAAEHGYQCRFPPSPAVLQQPEEFDKSVIKQLVENNNMSADATEEIDDPPELAVKLLRHQKRAVAWMIKREMRGADPVVDQGAGGDGGGVGPSYDLVRGDDSGSDGDGAFVDLGPLTPCLGGILADEQGLGKTLSVVALMLVNPPPPVDGAPSKWRTLVICPVSLVGQWKEEIESRIRAPHRPSVYVYHGPKRTRDPAVLAEFDVVITTYTTLTNEYPKVLKGDPMYAALKKAKQPVPRRPGGPIYACSWYRAVLDESHHIKNRRTEGWAAAGQLPAERRWCLTGTPIQNSVDDIYALFCFIRYRFLAKNNYKTWNERWKKKLESGDARTRMRTFKRFQTIVAVVTLRRTKLDTIEGKALISLPPRRTEVRETAFTTPLEVDLYTALKATSQSELKRYASSAGGLGQNYTGIMLLLLRLRQACCHPFLSEYAASKRRGVNGTGDASFVSPYSVDDLDKTQQLVEAGVSYVDMLAPAAQEAVMTELAPPKAGQALSPIPDLFGCNVCSRMLPCKTLRVLPAGNIVCRPCAADILTQHTSGRPEDDPFMELDDLRREVHVKVRTARWLGGGGGGGGGKRAKPDSGGDSAASCLAVAAPKAAKTGAEGKRKKAAAARSDADGEAGEVDPKMRLPSTKLSIMLEVVRAMRARNAQEKCLIFSQWTSMLDIISLHVTEAGFKCCRLDGTMSMLKRKEQVDTFRSDDSVTIFLLSMHAAGTGLNLTQASNVILADAWWNPSVEAQCCDRAHRIGQTRPVNITRLKIAGTCEEKIYELCARKAETCASALGESGGKSGGRQRLTLEDALSLFGNADPVSSVPPWAGADDAARAAAAEVGQLLQGGGGGGGGGGGPGGVGRL